MTSIGDLWTVLKPGVIPVEVSPETESVLRRVFFIGAAAALSLHGSVQADEQRVTRKSLESLEEEIATELGLPDGGE